MHKHETSQWPIQFEEDDSSSETTAGKGATATCKVSAGAGSGAAMATGALNKAATRFRCLMLGEAARTGSEELVVGTAEMDGS